MRRLSRPAGDAVDGFTLIEALMAIALMGVILAALATITGQWLPNWNHGFARVQRDEHLALGLERVVADLAAAEFVPAGRGTQKPLFDGADLSVTFVRTALGPNARPGLEVVRIDETNSQRGPTLVRMRAPFAPMLDGDNDPNQLHFTDPVVLIRAPYRLAFSYAGADRIWRNMWQKQDQLPRAVKLMLRDASTQRTLAASTATIVHAEIPAKCISAKSLTDCFGSVLRPSQSADVGNPSSSGFGQPQ